MSFLDDVKAAWKQEYTEQSDPLDRVATFVVGGVALLFALFIAFLLLSLVWLIFKAALPFIIGGGVVYAVGAWKLGWPLPSLVKKFIK